MILHAVFIARVRRGEGREKESESADAITLTVRAPLTRFFLSSTVVG